VSRHITIEAYFRLLIPFLFSEYINVLYLDGDMICLSDISNLFNLNLENFMLAAVWDTDVSRYYCPKDKKIILKRHSVLPYLKNPAAYFNAGLIVFNTQFFCNSLSFEKILEVTLSRKWKVHDQDILNYLAEDKVLLLPYNWNLMSCPRYDYLPSQQKNEFNDACKNPKIVHFKPWKKDIYIPFSHYFWKYAARTPFVEIITERMELEGFINNESLVERVISRFAKRGGIINKMLKFIFEDLIKNWILNSRYK
jgi:lipopolysaccharide biosynthesis glycosyltransferase